jgi:hypothetical protein
MLLYYRQDKKEVESVILLRVSFYPQHSLQDFSSFPVVAVDKEEECPAEAVEWEAKTPWDSESQSLKSR